MCVLLDCTIATVIKRARDTAAADRRATVFASLACLVLSRHVHTNLSAYVHLEIRKPLANHPRHRRPRVTTPHTIGPPRITNNNPQCSTNRTPQPLQ